MWLQSIRRQIDVADAIVANKEIDDLGQFFSERRFSAAEPEIRERRCVLRQFHDLFPGQIAFLVEFVPVEARLARRIAVRSNEEDDRVQLSLAVESPNTRVSLGEISL